MSLHDVDPTVWVKYFMKSMDVADHSGLEWLKLTVAVICALCFLAAGLLAWMKFCRCECGCCWDQQPPPHHPSQLPQAELPYYVKEPTNDSIQSWI